MSIPITVFTGFVGAGKTTTILGLLASLPKGYRACLLKNEFGDVQVDSQLAKQSSLASVNEILNGCMCCVLIGQMKTALLEIKGRLQIALSADKYNPDRIFIETSGSAFPATLAFQIRELERETDRALKLDAIVTVVDAENFTGYEDTSPTARMQASYSDVILINKWENVSGRQLDLVLDHLHTLNDLTPKIRCKGRGGVDPALIFGLDTKLFSDPTQHVQDGTHNDEVQTFTLWRGTLPDHTETCACEAHHQFDEQGGKDGPILDEAFLSGALTALPKESVWRVKGFVRLVSLSHPSAKYYIVNWAFGRLELTMRLDADVTDLEQEILLTIMGERGEMKRFASNFAKVLGAHIR